MGPERGRSLLPPSSASSHRKHGPTVRRQVSSGEQMGGPRSSPRSLKAAEASGRADSVRPASSIAVGRLMAEGAAQLESDARYHERPHAPGDDLDLGWIRATRTGRRTEDKRGFVRLDNRSR